MGSGHAGRLGTNQDRKRGGPTRADADVTEEECGCEGINEYGLSRGDSHLDKSNCRYPKLHAALTEARERLDRITRQRNGLARSFIAVKKLLMDGSLLLDDRAYEWWQAEVAKAIPQLRVCEDEANRALSTSKEGGGA